MSLDKWLTGLLTASRPKRVASSLRPVRDELSFSHNSLNKALGPLGIFREPILSAGRAMQQCRIDRSFAAFSHSGLPAKPPQCSSPMLSYVHHPEKSLQLVKQLWCRAHLRAVALGQGFPTKPMAQLTNKNSRPASGATAAMKLRSFGCFLARRPKKATRMTKSSLQYRLERATVHRPLGNGRYKLVKPTVVQCEHASNCSLQGRGPRR